MGGGGGGVIKTGLNRGCSRKSVNGLAIPLFSVAEWMTPVPHLLFCSVSAGVGADTVTKAISLHVSIVQLTQ